MMLPDAKGTLLSCHIAVKAAVKLSDIRIAIFFLMGQRITNWERNFWDRFSKKKPLRKKPTIFSFINPFKFHLHMMN